MKKKILIVEDEFIVAEDIQLTLQRAGYEVTDIAISVPAAIQSINDHLPELVLLDIFLQGPENGLDLGKELELRCIPFIYLTANNNPQIQAAARRTNPKAFMAKPFRDKDLLANVQRALLAP
ncbi:response regulator [Chitinophaga sp. sic0106]|uniref:response regulator n=1 Tax=Chitinophaga sp. sic0106 TaxID=2854785 RepID=UPI001C45A4B9|nr:response regulator [Chitinophaga sp. sic0106]MBV7532563.1 response regulator [Chitinophaga sp. sic0106]